MIAPTFLNQHRGRGVHEQADVNISPPRFLFRLCSGVPTLKPFQGGSSAWQQQPRIGRGERALQGESTMCVQEGTQNNGTHQ